MSKPSPKLVAIAFGKTSKNPLLQQFEALYVYGVLNQLARFTETQYKDLATTADRITLDAKLSYDDTLKKLSQVCQSTRTQYLFTGALSPSIGGGEHLSEIKVTFRLYEQAANQYVVDEVVHLPLLQVQSQTAEQTVSDFPVNELNRLINDTVARFAKAIFGDDPANRPGTAPFSTSIKAMRNVLKAHQVNVNAEKISLYSDALFEDPQLETAYYHLARIYRSENDYEKAVVNYRRALEVSHSSPRNKAMLATDAGIACALLGKADFAVQWWMKAIEYDANYINPFFNIANVYEDQDQYPQAEQYFIRAQALAPDDFRTYFNLARIYSKMGAWEKALSQYRMQLKTEDGDPWCHSDVATCYLNLGDVDSARQHLERTMQLDPEGEAGQYAQLILGGLG